MSIFQKDDFLYYKNSSGSIVREVITVEKVINTSNSGALSILNENEDMGVVMYSVCEKNGVKVLNFQGLCSFVEGKFVGTKLVYELIKLSKEMGCDGRLAAQASPFRLSQNPGVKIDRPLSNLLFYYKLGFRADDEKKNRDILQFIKQGEKIPLGLNVFTDISLSKEAAEALELKQCNLKKSYELQQNVIAQKIQNKALNKI